MSYDIVCWEGTRPMDDRSAALEYARLLDSAEWKRAAPPSSTMVEFLRQLTARYPDNIEEGGVWAMPLDDSVHGELALICVNYSNALDVIPFVVEVSAEHGLVCFDPQSDSLI